MAAKNIQEAIVHRIAELCEQNQITISGLATKCGLNRSTIRDIMSGESKTSSIKTIKIICDGLDIKLKDFFDTDEFDNLEQEIR